MNVAYVRVSTVEQNETRQIEALKPHGIDKWFTEKISGKNTQRPQLQAMLDFVREDTPMRAASCSCVRPACRRSCFSFWASDIAVPLFRCALLKNMAYSHSARSSLSGGA